MRADRARGRLLDPGADRDSGKVMIMIGNLPNPTGGVESLCYHLCEELNSLGVAVHFLDTEANDQKTLPPLASYAMVSRNRPRAALALLRHAPGLSRQYYGVARPVSRKSGFRTNLGCTLLAAEVVRTVRQTGAPAILAHHAGTRGLAGLMAARALLGTRLLVYAHGSEWVARTGVADAVLTANTVARRADAVIVNSAYTGSLCAENAGRRDFLIGHPGVDHERFHPGPRVTPETESVVLFAGRLHARKGPQVLARAMALIRSDQPVRFVFAGPDHGQAERIRKVAAASGMEGRVDFRGQVSPAELAILYRSADVVVVPSTSETFGMVVTEALASGVPVVGSRVGAIPELLEEGPCGLLFAPGDPADLADKVSILLNDRALHKAMADAALKRVREFRWDRLAQLVLQAAAGKPGP